MICIEIYWFLFIGSFFSLKNHSFFISLAPNFCYRNESWIGTLNRMISSSLTCLSRRVWSRSQKCAKFMLYYLFYRKFVKDKIKLITKIVCNIRVELWQWLCFDPGYRLNVWNRFIFTLQFILTEKFNMIFICTANSRKPWTQCVYIVQSVCFGMCTMKCTL